MWFEDPLENKTSPVGRRDNDKAALSLRHASSSSETVLNTSYISSFVMTELNLNEKFELFK